jgi:hypothetical protein
MKKITLLLLALFFVSSLSHAADSKKSKKEEVEDQRQRNYGYAIIYNAFDQLQWTDTIVGLKVDAQQVTDIVKDLEGTSKNFQKRFDELKKDYPALKYDDTGRPKILEMKNKDQAKDRIKTFLPIVGKTGPDFERNFLMFLSGAINELHYLSKNLAEMEPNEGLKKFLGEIQVETKRIDNRMQELLNKKYFKHNTFKAEKVEKKD